MLDEKELLESFKFYKEYREKQMEKTLSFILTLSASNENKLFITDDSTMIDLVKKIIFHEEKVEDILLKARQAFNILSIQSEEVKEAAMRLILTTLNMSYAQLFPTLYADGKLKND